MSDERDLDKFYRVRMSDDSLRDVGIRKGDVLKLRRSATFWTGDLIAAQTPGGLFVALAYHEPGGMVRLEGAHPKCCVRRYPRRAVRVLGVASANHETDDDDPGGPGVDGLDWPEFIGGAA
jgi:SOS-response transcriptional repressor LexA